MKGYRTDEIRNVVLLGHGGSGKTSLAEAMAYVSGATSRMGKIADGNTISDFDKEEQKRLKRCCDLLDKRGVKFMLSNSATEFIKSLYGDYDVTIVKAKRIINSNVNGRGTVDEVLIRNYGKK